LDKHLLIKYFRNQCSLDEVEQVLRWFQSEEGKHYLENRLDHDMSRYSQKENLLLSPDIDSHRMLTEIEKATSRSNSKYTKKDRWWLRVAVVLLISTFLAFASYWMVAETSLSAVSEYTQNENPVYHRIAAEDGPQRLITLGDGTTVRLNSSAILEIPENYPIAGRRVRVQGEAYFDVVHNENEPFIVDIDDAVIHVLGTEFNVKENLDLHQVQVAVVDGKVSLSNKEDFNGREVVLTKNTFASLDIKSGIIVMENTAVDNYLSWISGKLQFYDESLRNVSNYLNRLYGVKFHFESSNLSEKYISVEVMDRGLEYVLDIVSQTIGISYQYCGGEVTWMEAG